MAGKNALGMRVVQFAMGLVCLLLSSRALALSTTAVVYGGGPIVQPEIVPIYWGTFTTAQVNAMQTYLQGLATYISGSLSPQGQEPTVWQYGVRGARLYNGASPYFCNAPVVNPNDPRGWPGNIIDSMLQNSRSSSFSPSLPAPSAERLFVFLTNGVNFNVQAGTCGFHAGNTSEGWWAEAMLAGSSCPLKPTLAIFQSSLSHEILEAAGDPDQHSGWTLSVPNNGREFGDPPACGQNNVSVVGVGPVQKIWDTLQGGICSGWTPEQFPQVTEVTQPLAGGVEMDLFALASDHSVWHLFGSSFDGWQGRRSTWEALNGNLTSPPVALAGATGSGSLHVFGQGLDNGFWYDYWNGTSWSGWYGLGGAFNGPPAVVSRAQNIIDVFGLANDGFYYLREWNGSWSNWTPMPAQTFNGPPTAMRILQQPDAGVWGRGNDGNYYESTWYGTGFTSWFREFDSGYQFINEPVVATNGADWDIFGSGTDWKYYHRHEHLNSFTSEEVLSGTYMGPPAAQYQSSNTLDVVGQGTDTGWYHLQELNGSGWQTFQSTNGSGSGGVSLVSPAPGELHAVAVGGDYNLWFDDLQGTSWAGWVPLPVGPQFH